MKYHRHDSSVLHLLTVSVLQPFNSSGNALTFSGIPVSSAGHFVTSIPLPIEDVSSSARALFEENFDPVPFIP